MKKVAFITGITGQDGSYLAELLLSKDYIVHGMMRRLSAPNTARIDSIFDKVQLHYGDITSPTRLTNLLNKIRPHEIYHLAAQSHVKVSFDDPINTLETSGMGIAHILEAVRTCNLGDHTRIYNASTSEQFGKVTEIPQTELTPFHPRSPYGCAKLMAHNLVINYREAYGFFAVNGILFNHGSPRRGITFVERKICRGVARIHMGLDHTLYLGNLDAKRDWGHARDYVQAMWSMLQATDPEDYVIATGQMYSVRDLVVEAFSVIGRNIIWKDHGLEEIGIDEKSGQVLIRLAERYFRPAEVDVLCGDATKAKKHLNWKPKVGFSELVREMVESDIRYIRDSHSERDFINCPTHSATSTSEDDIDLFPKAYRDTVNQ